MSLCGCGCGKETKYTFCRGHNFRTATHRAKVSRTHRGKTLTNDAATVSPSIMDVAWAAGFLEGEGSFFAQAGKWAQVSATQVQREPLDRLASFFGGRVWERKSRRVSWQPTHWWRICGPRARGVSMTVYPLMSPRRQGQILSMLRSDNEATG